MKKLILLVVLVVGVAFFAGCKGSAEENQTKPDENAIDNTNGMTEETMPDIEVKILDIEAFSYVCVEETGSFDKMEKTISNFWTEVGKQQIKPAGMLMFGVYYGDPSMAEEEWKWEVGIKVIGDAKVQEPLKLKEWKYTKVASHIALGPYEETEGKLYSVLYAKIAKMGYTPAGPAMSIYHNNPNNVKPEEIKTELTVPVTKTE